MAIKHLSYMALTMHMVNEKQLNNQYIVMSKQT